jgi:hypothetical protein
MRIIFSKFAALALVGLMAFGALPVVSAQAQTPEQIAAAVQAAQGGDNSLLATLVNTPGANMTAIGSAVATALDSSVAAGSTGAASNLASALIATNNTALIAGVMIAPGMSGGAQTALVSALVTTGNAALIAGVQASAQSAGATPTALAALATLATAIGTGTTLAVAVAAAAPVNVITPSPAQASAS